MRILRLIFAVPGGQVILSVLILPALRKMERLSKKFNGFAMKQPNHLATESASYGNPLRMIMEGAS